MQRKLEYRISKKQEGRTIQEFLKDEGYSSKLISELKKQPCQILRNEEAAFTNEKLEVGDVLEIYLIENQGSEQIVPNEGRLDIIYEDEDILVVNKPAGMAIHPSINHHEKTLANIVVWYYKQKGSEYTFRCMNRLDKDTSGLVLLAKHALSAAVLARSMKNGEIHKEYRIIVKGKLPQEGSIEAPIGRAEGSIIERTVDFENGKEAMTHYRSLAYQEDSTYALVWLDTGRTHQIRVHMKYIGHPLLGDFLYYPKKCAIKRQALHAYSLTFEHPILKIPMNVIAPLPEDMCALLENKKASQETLEEDWRE